MANTFNIRQLTADAHGYGNANSILSDTALSSAHKIGKAAIGKTFLGTPFFMDVIIDGIRLPNEPLITISGQHHIVGTALSGSKRRGTVKEFIRPDDYRIKIEGVCITPGQKEYPQSQVEQIISLIEKRKSLDFQNDIAELFGIHKAVIKTYNFDSMQGKPYSQKYSLTLLSDEDFYAELLHKNRSKILS